MSTSVFTKPTDRKNYLHSKSYHPKSIKESIAFSQATRLKRICTEEADIRDAADKLKNDLINRGYKDEKITKEINCASIQNRGTLLTYKEREENTRIPLVVTYNMRLPKLKPILEDSLKILGINDTER